MSLLALKDLFARHRAHATGLWRLGQDPTRTVFFDAGDIVFATSTHPLERLTHLLVERGKITQAQLDYTMTNLKPAVSIGKNLIEMGFITQRDLVDVARAQVERVVGAGIAEAADVPAFEAKDLDASTVRLPSDTATMLLAGVLDLKDRERVLEELGPLNQVVVLEGRRRLQELPLPQDLARVPDLLDGSRTLMELSRESGVEPFRLGAFILFLREIGWARLHELPPLDRRALELALDPPDSVITPPLPEPAETPLPSLFTEIRASQRPTTNLEHLSESLDSLNPEDDLEAPFSPEPDLPAPVEPALPIQHAAADSTEGLDLPAAQSTAPASSRRPLVLVLLLLLLGGLWAGIRWFHRHRSPQLRTQNTGISASKPPQVPTPEAAKSHPGEKPDRLPLIEAPKPDAPKPEPPKPVPPALASPIPPLPKPAATTLPSRAERLQTLLQGDLKRALTQGMAHVKTLEGRWSLRLEIACQDNTVLRAADLLKNQDPDLFLLPMVMRDGRTCYQVYFGSFGSEAAARDSALRLPPPFLAEGSRPKPFRVTQIPDRQ